ncbi:MAG: hypothetical protein ACRDD7_04505 [Peptostreptococcaceae bacterium]
MNRFMYLFDFEFKRNFKNYINIISIFCLIFVWDLIDMLKDYNYVINAELKNKSLEALTNKIGPTSFSNVISLWDSSASYFLGGLIFCIGYSILIWKKDLSGKTKSIYTLAMLPQDRMKIYMSKFLNIIALIYMYTMTFTLVLFISYLIIPFFMKGDVNSLGFINDTIHQFAMFMPYNIEVFVVVYVFGISAIISTIFTLMINKKGKFSIIKIIIMCFVFIILFLAYGIFSYEIENLIINIFGYNNLNLSICIISSIIIAINLTIAKIKLSKIDF